MAHIRLLHPSVTLSNMYFSETSRPGVIKFYQKHHCGGRLPALGFKANRIRSMVIAPLWRYKDNHDLCLPSEGVGDIFFLGVDPVSVSAGVAFCLHNIS